MKAARLYGPYDVRLEEVPPPGLPGPEEVVIQVEFAGLCGTDATQYTSATLIPLDKPHPVSGQKAPIILGHEMVGTIVAVGSAVEHMTRGQRVVPGAAWWCGTCAPCQDRRSTLCQQAFLYGIHADGGLAELVRLPARMCVPVPAGCPPEVAVLAQPLAVAFHALQRVDWVHARNIALFGVGSIGALLLAIGACHAEGDIPGFAPANVIAIDRNAERLAQAAAFGCGHVVNAHLDDPVSFLRELTEGRGVDVAIEATGNHTCIDQAIASLKHGGQWVQIGLPSRPVSLDLSSLVRTEKVLITTNGHTSDVGERGNLNQALDLLAHSQVADLLRTQVIELDDLVEQGLKPLAESRAPARILVRLSPRSKL